MKLRQKLAATLAAAMVVTAVPVVTMASSSNKVVKTVSVEEDEKTTGAVIKIKFEDGSTDTEEFYFTLTNAEWLDATDSDDDGESRKKIEGAGFTIGAGNVWSFDFEETVNGVTSKTATVKYTREGDDVVRVNVVPEEDKTLEGKTINFTLPIQATGGSVAVKVSGEGSNSTITEGSYTVGSTGEKAAAVVVDDVKSFYDEGELSKIVLKETFVGSLVDGNKDLLLCVELSDSDFEFVQANPTVKGTYGFGKIDGQITATMLPLDSKDKSTAYIQISGLTKGTSLGRLEITGLKVTNDEKEITTGDLLAAISLENKYNGNTYADVDLDQSYNNVVIAKIADFGATITMKNEKAVDIVAGRDEEVEFTVAETVDGTFEEGRTMTITLDSDEYDDSFFWIQYNGDHSKLVKTDDNKVVKSVQVVWNDEDAIKEAIKDAETAADKSKLESASYKADAIKVTFDTPVRTKKEADKFTVKTTIYVPVDQKDKKELSLVASGRGIDEVKSAVAVNVLNPFDVTFEQTTLKVGLQNQTVGKFTLTETDKEMFQTGKINFNFVKGSKINTGIVIEDEGDLTVTGDLKNAEIDDVNSTNSKITLNRQSKSASALTVENMEITVDRTVPEGSYDLEISGDAIDIHGGKLKVKDFLVIGTPNTQDMSASNGLAKGTATFAIGGNTYTLNGEEKTMDAASYIQDPGYTMVPVRYVAQAFGVSESDIMFGKGTVTIFAGNRTVQLTNGSDVAIVNGANVAMATKVVIKDGRTYAPIGEIAKILGVSSSWDNTTKTATFENK